MTSGPSLGDRIERVGSLSPSQVDAELDRLEREVPTHPPLERAGLSPCTKARVFGDTHGDWSSLLWALDGAWDDPETLLIGLGDYVDRSPPDCPQGSAVAALFLLELVAERPDRLLLLQGNHETVDVIPVHPRSFEEEVYARWKGGPRRAARLGALLRRGPLAACTDSGAYLAHAGFPRPPLPVPWTRALDAPGADRTEEITWADCEASSARRGGLPPFGEEDLRRFLDAAGLSVFLRGHDPDLTGRVLWGNRLVTLHTTRVYARFGGIVAAEIPLDHPIHDLGSVRILRRPIPG
ncbi:MAG: metallophosphoesterase family protein [Thermoplasmata archaeon]